MNLVLWHQGSSAAVPFLTLVALLTLWFGVSVPLTFVGAFFGFRKTSIEPPVRTNQIPRQIPGQSFYTQVSVGAFVYADLIFDPESIQIRLHQHTNFSLRFAAAAGHRHGWDPAFRLHFYSALLCLALHLVLSNLLHVWIPVRCLCHPHHHLLRGYHPAVLLSPVRRGKYRQPPNCPPKDTIAGSYQIYSFPARIIDGGGGAS